MDIDYTRNKLIEIIKYKGISEIFLSMPGVIERIAEDRANMLESRISLGTSTNLLDGKATSFTYSTMDDRFMKFEMIEGGRVRINALPRQSGEKYPEETIILNKDGIDVGRRYTLPQGIYSKIIRGKGIIEEKFYTNNDSFSTYNFLDIGNWKLVDLDRNTLGIPLTVSYSNPENGKDTVLGKPKIMTEEEIEALIRKNSDEIVLRYPNCNGYFESLISNAKQAYEANMLVISDEYRKKRDAGVTLDDK